MNKFLFITMSLVLSNALASQATMNCVATIPGKTNFKSARPEGLNRITEIKAVEIGPGKIAVSLIGTGGTNTAGSQLKVEKELILAGSFGQILDEYNNVESAKGTVADPIIRLEREYAKNLKGFLGVLTVSTVNDGNQNNRFTLNSRYTCEIK